MDRVNAIFDMLPMIKETHRICMFMLENKGFNTAYKWYMEKDSQARKMEELFMVLDYYGIAHSNEKNVEVLKDIVYRKLEHIDIVCKYLALEWIAYDRDDFRYKPLPENEQKQQEYKPVSNPQASRRQP